MREKCFLRGKETQIKEEVGQRRRWRGWKVRRGGSSRRSWRRRIMRSLTTLGLVMWLQGYGRPPLDAFFWRAPLVPRTVSL